MKRYDCYYLFLWLLVLPEISIAQVTPNEVYAQAFRINEEINLFKRHLNLDETISTQEIKANISPHHVWQKTYEILFKLNILREKHGLPVIAVSSLEPCKKIIPLYVYEQTQRILTELNLLKLILTIEGESDLPPQFANKVPADVFNLLNHVSYQIDLLNGTAFSPSVVFAQAMRISDDVDVILRTLEIKNTVIPPAKQENITLLDAFETTLHLLKEIQRVQALVGVEGINWYAFKPNENITPTEIFGMTGIILAELQILKAHFELKHALTPLAKHYENKVPSDVQRVLSWSVRKMKLIQSLR